METGEWGGIIAAVFFGALMLGALMGWLLGRHGVLPARACRVDQQRMQLQVLIDRPNGERAWVDAAGEQGAAWKRMSGQV
jgi:hypothetical protein